MDNHNTAAYGSEPDHNAQFCYASQDALVQKEIGKYPQAGKIAD
jgi:hypothetical protein